MSLPRKNKPPHEDGTGSYIVPQLEGEKISIPGSKSVFRIFTPNVQSLAKTMAVFSSGGALADAPGFHHHEEAHDVFMVTKGFVKLWNGDRCKIMGPGDFAYIPPKVIHNPQLLGPHTETIGLITPASWVDFFRYVGEPFDGLLYPEYDERSLHENIIPKIMAAKGKYDVQFYPDYKGCEVSDWGPEDEKLPDGMAPFYLKANTGPRWMLGGVLSRPFVTTKQTGATFAISSIESSSTYGGTVFDQPMSFPTSHHCFCVFEGAVRISLSDGSSDTLHEGDSAFIAADTAFKLEFKSNFCRLWSFASGGGIEQLVQEAGEPYKGFALPDQAPPVDGEKVKRVLSELKIKV